jgi:Carboxypeptidase regulatory-like domain/TonB dependent receptor/TonB-dependent Receptor Plug Domain
MKSTRYLAVLMALVPAVALAIGEGNGSITGKLIEKESQAGVPGAKVVATSPALPGGARTVQSQEDGSFELNNLPPGLYTLDIQYEGLKPLKRRYEVVIGQATIANIQWSAELAQAETTVVTQERPLTRPDTAQTGRVLTAKDQEKIASPRSYQGILQQAAGVSGGANPNVRGGNLIQNRYLIDGIDITDVVTQTFSANINFDSIASVEFITGGFEAKYNTQGSVVNLITTQGSNQFNVDASLYLNNGAFSAPGQFGRNPTDFYRPFNTVPRPPTSSYQVNANGGGPIIQDKLWFNVSVQYANTQQSQPAGPPLNRQAPNRVSSALLLRGKLTWAPAYQHRVTLSISADPAQFDFVDFNGAAANTTQNLAARRQDQGGMFGTLIYEYFPTENITFRAQAGGQFGFLFSGPQGYLGSLGAEQAQYDFDRPRRVNQDDNTAWYNRQNNTVDLRRHISADALLQYRFVGYGKHAAEFGIQTRFADRQFKFEAPGGRTYVDAGGGPGEAGLCNEATGVGCSNYTTAPSYRNLETGATVGLYAQDKWKILPNLQVTPGLRLDYGTMTDAAKRNVGSLFGVGPRLAVAWDVTKDAKTVLTAHYGRSTEVMSLLAAANASPPAVTSTYAFAGPRVGWQLQGTAGGPDGVTVDPSKARTPTTDEFSLGARRQVLGGNVVGADFIHRIYSNQWEVVETNYIFDPSGTRVVGFANGKPGTVNLITTPERNTVRYTGVDLTLDARPNEYFSAFASYTLGFRYGPGTDVLGQTGPGLGLYQFQNPRQAEFFDAFAPGDIRHNLKFVPTATVENFTVGGVFNYQSGAPLVRRYRVADPFLNDLRSPGILRSPYGTQPGTPNDLEQITEFRLPDTISLDVRLSYDFAKLFRLKQSRIILIADLFNVVNLAAPLSLQENDNTATVPNQFGQVLARQQPFRAQFGLRFTY